MSLKDFMQKLQEQEDSDVIYSSVPESSIKIIPPTSKPVTQINSNLSQPDVIKVLPPGEEVEKPAPFRLNINVQPPSPSPQVVTTPSQPKLKIPNQDRVVISAPPPQKPQNVVEPSQKPNAPTPQPKKNKEELEIERVEQLFKNSGTDISKRAIWYEYYNRALASKKKNSVVERTKQGKFMITSENELYILPDYDVVSNSAHDILDDKWLLKN